VHSSNTARQREEEGSNDSGDVERRDVGG